MLSLQKLSLYAFFILVSSIGFSQEKQEEKIIASTKVLQDFSGMKENIPAKLLALSEGMVIIPKMINAGLGIGGKRGKGIAILKASDGTWSNPVFVTMTGGSVGLQIGFQSVDLVLIFTHRENLEDIGRGSFTLGGDAAVTAGPVGRSSSAGTDLKFDADIYSYSRSKGLFAGITLSGSVIDVDEKANEKFYGEEVDSKTLFDNNDQATGPEVDALWKILNRLNK